MTYKIERFSEGTTVVLRVSGRIRAEYLSTIKEMIEHETGRVALDLTEVTLVDRDAVPFLAAHELKGIELTNCPAFLREWIDKEKLGEGEVL